MKILECKRKKKKKLFKKKFKSNSTASWLTQYSIKNQLPESNLAIDGSDMTKINVDLIQKELHEEDESNNN